MSNNSKIYSQYIQYVKDGNLPEIKQLIETNQIVPYANFNQAIIWGARNGHVEVVKYLSALPGVYPAAKNNLAIIEAARKGHLEVVQFLSTLPVDVTD